MAGRNPSVTIDQIRSEFAEKGAVLLTNKYINCQQQLQFKCSKCGKVHQIAYRNYKAGRNPNLLCKDCMKSVTIEDIRKEFKKAGAILLSETFDTVDVPLEVKCGSCGDTFTITWANYKAGHNKSLLCSACLRKARSNTTVIGNVKLEVITKENKANDLYNKKLQEYKQGILYVPLYPNEKGLPLIKSMVENRNNVSNVRIYARNCSIEKLSTAKEFLKVNHIQGYRKASVTVGLYYKDILVSVMSFDKPRYNAKYEYELIRLATLQGYEVVGGASKLFKWFVINYKPKSIISYCDIRFCKPDPDQTVYNKLGFKYINKTSANYRYWSPDLSKYYTRMACQKHRLEGFLSNFDSNKTEYQNMKDNGFIRIHDCGNYVFGWNC